MFSSWNEAWEQPDQMREISTRLVSAPKKKKKRKDNNDSYNSDNSSDHNDLDTEIIDPLTTQSLFTSLSDLSANKSEIPSFSLLSSEKKPSCDDIIKHVRKCKKCNRKLTQIMERKVKAEYHDIYMNNKTDDNKDKTYSLITGNNIKDSLIIVMGAIIIIFIIFLLSRKN
jgi:hypothetical protein